MYPGLANAYPRSLRMFIRKLRTENCLKRKELFSLYLRTLSLIPNNFYIYTPQDVYMYHFYNIP